jgi:raffinose/stachyose/melibiose transport system substrate-binding protein
MNMKKSVKFGASAVLTTGMLAAVGSNLASAKTSIPSLSYKGTITMYAQANTPYVPGVYLSPGSAKLTGFEDAAKGFKKLYPGITIKFVNSNTYGSTQWYQTEAAGGQLPDVSWVQAYTAYSALPKGVFTNLAPYFNQPDPYIANSKKWSDIMNPRILEMTKAPGDEQYVVDGDWVGTAFYYNKALFKKAGITSEPKTWAQLIADSKKLKAAGIDPGAIDSSTVYSWWNRIFSANVVGQKVLNQLLSYDHAVGSVSSTDEVKGYENGVLNPAKNPALTAWWPAVKNLLSLWDQSVLEVPVTNTNPSEPTAENLFAAQKIAICYSGSWTPQQVRNLPKKQQFVVGSFNIDNLTGTSKNATNLVTTQDVGGPFAAFQYGVATHKSDSTMTPQKLQAVIAWTQFFAQPKWDQIIVDEQGSFIPTFKGTVPTPANANLAADISKPFYSMDLYSNLTAQAGTQLSSLFQEYVTGHLSFKDAVNQYSQDAAAAVQQYKSTNNVQ